MAFSPVAGQGRCVHASVYSTAFLISRGIPQIRTTNATSWTTRQSSLSSVVARRRQTVVRTRASSSFPPSYGTGSDRDEDGSRLRSLSSAVASGAFSAADSGGTGGSVVPSDLRQEVSQSYMEYAMSVILGRALPDVRDGLKPVHRRILYAMQAKSIGASSQYRKCARVVGEVLGKYHPHGDTAVYDALVRMAQDFSMGIPLIDGHGNFGSTDGDPAAAMRYTECRLAPLARDALLGDLTKDTVDFVSNFDGSEEEPLVLPARVPVLLVNGSSGIAVGMATNIPPHNLRELGAAVRVLLKDPNVRDDVLFRKLPAPDFPTGGQILGREGAQQLYKTGRGRIMMRAKVRFEEIGGKEARRVSRTAIVVTELPYQVNKANLVEKIAELVNDKKLEGIADLRDESDRNGTRVVIELKRDSEKEVVLNNLYKKTALQHSFAANFLALDQGRTPIRFSLRECLVKFIEFRREVIRRRTGFELQRASERLHIVNGFLAANANIDAVVATIRGADSPASAVVRLQEVPFGLSKIQAEAILSMQLRRLTGMEQKNLLHEAESLNDDVKRCTAVLDSPDLVDSIVGSELEDTIRKHAVKRRSIIIEGNYLDAAEIDDLSLLPNESCVAVTTQQGFIKRMRAKEFESQNRGTRGKRGMGNVRKSDVVSHFFTCMTHDTLIAISKRGIAYALPAYKVPIGSRTSRGTPLFQLLPDLGAGESIASVLPVSEFRDDEFFVLLTKNGLLKKTALSAFSNVNARGKFIISLRDEDELKWVRRCSNTDSMIIGSTNGYTIRISLAEESVRACGRTAYGMLAMRLGSGDAIAGMDVLHGECESEDSRYVLMITSDGRGKRVEASAFRIQKRGGIGVIGIKFKPPNEQRVRVVSLQACNDGESVMLATSKGNIVRQPVSSIEVKSRIGLGILIQRLDAEDEVAAATILPLQVGSDVVVGDGVA